MENNSNEINLELVVKYQLVHLFKVNNKDFTQVICVNSNVLELERLKEKLIFELERLNEIYAIVDNNLNSLDYKPDRHTSESMKRIRLDCKHESKIKCPTIYEYLSDAGVSKFRLYPNLEIRKELTVGSEN